MLERIRSIVNGSLLRVVLVSAALFLPRLAMAQPQPQNPTDAEPSCVFYDSCTWDTGPTGTGTGTYAYCVARASRGQKCRDVVTVYIPNSACANGCNMCASVRFSAACECEDSSLKTTGSCTYW
jgi:hypothetical protein